MRKATLPTRNASSLLSARLPVFAFRFRFRFVWLFVCVFTAQVAVDYSEERHMWCDMIRVWAVHDKHDRYERALQHSKTLATIIASHRRSMQVRQRLKLVQVCRSCAQSTTGVCGQFALCWL